MYHCVDSHRRKASGWLDKHNLPTTILTTKFSILHKIRLYNWLPPSHKTTITKNFASLLHLIVDKRPFNLRKLIFKHIMSHAESKAVKLGIGYPSMIFRILLSQNSSLASSEDVYSSKKNSD